MKLYEIEMTRTSFVKVVIEAENTTEAEYKAFEEVTHGDYGVRDGADWQIQTMKEVPDDLN